MRIKDLRGIIFESNHNTIRETVEAAVQQVVNLKRADLTRTNLTEADLTATNHTKTDLSKTILAQTNLIDSIGCTRETLISKALKRLSA